MQLDFGLLSLVRQQDFNGFLANRFLVLGFLGGLPARLHRYQPSFLRDRPEGAEDGRIGDIIGEGLAVLVRGERRFLDEQAVAILEDDHPLGLEVELAGLGIGSGELLNGICQQQRQSESGEEQAAAHEKFSDCEGLDTGLGYSEF